MWDSFKTTENNYVNPQCQYFVLRKKRLCRMTVKPGKNYCGEHEPQPKTDNGEDDTRIPCPYDPKHTCYASKLKKHLAICNSRQQDQPDYIIHNINAPTHKEDSPRLPLNKIPSSRIINVIEKVNNLYKTHVKDIIATLPEQPIHSAVIEEFNVIGRAESSLRHLRQASSLLHVIEQEGLATNNTCYVELGAGKGHLSYYAWWAWCQRSGSRVLLVDRASLRHKRDNKLRDTRQTSGSSLQPSSDAPSEGLQELADESVERCDTPCGSDVQRIRADLAHLALERVPAVLACAAVVGFAKHLCGVATDYALRCVSTCGRARGAALATCCHHRCERAASVAAPQLTKYGIDGDDFNTILGIVSWATCGDGRSRQRRAHDSAHDTSSHHVDIPDGDNTEYRVSHNPNGSNKKLHSNDDLPGDYKDSHLSNNPDDIVKLHLNDNPYGINTKLQENDSAEDYKDSYMRNNPDGDITKSHLSGNPNDINRKLQENDTARDYKDSHRSNNPDGNITESHLSDNPDDINRKLPENDDSAREYKESHQSNNPGDVITKAHLSDNSNGDNTNSQVNGNHNRNNIESLVPNNRRQYNQIHVSDVPTQDDIFDITDNKTIHTKNCVENCITSNDSTAEANDIQHGDAVHFGAKNLNLNIEQREKIGRRAKAVLDWGRVLYLEEQGFDARLVRFVPTGVSLENMCIVAKKVDRDL